MLKISATDALKSALKVATQKIVEIKKCQNAKKKIHGSKVTYHQKTSENYWRS